MVSPFVAGVAALVLLWLAGEPFCSHSRGLAADAMPLAFAAPLSIAWVGLARFGAPSDARRIAGPLRFVELAAAEPALVAVLATCIVLAASPPWDVHLGFTAGAIAWLLLGVAHRRARADQRRVDALALVAVLALVAAALVGGRWASGALAAAGALLALGAVLALLPRPLKFGTTATRRVIGLVALALCVPLNGALLECLTTLQPIEFAITPILWLVLWALAEQVRDVAARRDALEADGMAVRWTPDLAVTIAPWAWLVVVQVAFGALWSRQLLDRSVGPFLAVVGGAAVVVVAIGSLARQLGPPGAAWDARRLSDVRAGLLPLAAPLLAFACLWIAPLPAEWSAVSGARGLLAVLAPQFALPLAGAALVAAVAIDRLAGARRTVWLALGAAAIAWGASSAAPSLATGFPAGFERAGLDVHALRPWCALLVALAALATWQRLSALARGQRAPLATLAAAPAVAVPAALVFVPSDGPIGALWASCAGLAALVAVDASRARAGRSAAVTATPH